MKTLTHLLAALSILTAAQCALPNSVRLASKWDESFDHPIKSVYIEANEVGKKDEAMYAIVVKSFEKSLRRERVTVREDFTGNTPEEARDSTAVLFRPDAILMLGKPLEDVEPLAVSIPVPGGFIQPTTKRKRFIVQLVKPVTKDVIWIGEVSFVQYDAKFVGNRVVHQWVAAGVLPSTKPD